MGESVVNPFAVTTALRPLYPSRRPAQPKPPRVYIASSMRHGPLWQAWASAHLEKSRGFRVISRWPVHAADELAETPGNAKLFWQHDIEDVLSADLLLCYAADGDTPRGALVETGVALASGIPVLAVGPATLLGTWIHHSGVYHVEDLTAALEWLRAWQLPQR